MLRQSIALFIFLIIAFARTADAQSPSYVRYGPENGLNSTTVYYAFQDSKGYMWFGTDAGVSRFDGKHFESFTTADGLSDNEVLRIFQDRSDRIWFLLFNGRLSYYKDGKFYNEAKDTLLKRAFSGEHYDSFFEDSRGRLFFGTGHGYYIVVSGNSLKRFTLNDFISEEITFTESLNHEVILNSGYYQYIHTDSTPRILNTFRCKTGYARNMISYRNNALFLNEDGLYCQDSKGIKAHMPPEFFPDLEKSLIGVREDLIGDIWVMRWSQGASQFSHKNGEWRLVNQHLTSLSVHSVYPDREGNLWFCTNDDGVYLLKRNTAGTLRIDNMAGLATNNIHVLGTDDKGNVWAGGNALWVSCINGDSIKNYQLLDNPYYGRIRDFLFDSKKRIWFVADQGIFYFNKNKSVLVPAFGYNMRRDDYSAKFIQEGKGGMISITTSKRMLYLEDNINPLQLRLNEFVYDTITFTRTFCHYHDLSGRLWISNLNGLHIYDNDSLLRIENDDPGLHSRVVRITETKDSTLVICTEGHGVIFYKDGMIVNRLGTGNGLPSSLCRNISVSGNTLLISTNAGLLSVDYRNNIFSNLQVFSTADGLPNSDIRAAIIVNRKIYVATSAGVSVIRYSEAVSKSHPPELYITGVVQDGLALKMDSVMHLAYDRNRLGIHYHALTFQRPDQIQYQYKINSEWISTTNDFIEVASLPPGNYNFQVRARKYDSDWSQPVSLSFTIKPPFWGTTWFKGVSVLLFIGLAVQGGVMINRRKLRHAQRELEKVNAVNSERNRISSDLHDDIGSGLTEIAIFSSVGKQIQQPEESMKLFSRISVASAGLLDNISEIVWTLNSSNDSLGNLIAYIREYTSDFCDKHQFDCSIDIPGDIPDRKISAFARRNIFLIVKEGLTNSLKHAACNKIEVKIELWNTDLLITLADNGKGFGYDSESLRRSGLSNMKRRMTEIGGSIQISASKGTIICIRYPLPAFLYD